MGFTNGEQLRELWLCGGVGFLLGAYYDMFRVWRVWFSPRVAVVFWQDVWYCLTSVVAVFIMLLVITDGQGRFYVYLGLVVGFFAYRSLLGRYTLRVTTAIKHFATTAAKKHAKKPKKRKKGLESQATSGV